MPATKAFRISGDKIVAVAPGRGSCIASDMILVDGHPVGYMYREPPDLEHDSGWRFFSGLESQDYADDTDHFGLSARFSLIAMIRLCCAGIHLAPVFAYPNRPTKPL